MKKIFKVLLIAVIVFSCKKESSDNGLSPKINNILANSIIKDLESRGMVINKGAHPPKVEGIFFVSPFKLISRFAQNDPFEDGKIISDYLFKIYDQVGDEAKFDYKASSTADIATGLGSFISGSDNKFTLFAQNMGTLNGVDYKVVSVLTGEITTEGIKNLQYAFVLTDKKGDENNLIVMPKGKSRIYKDANNISERKNAYTFAFSPNTDINKLAASSVMGVK